MVFEILKKNRLKAIFSQRVNRDGKNAL